MTRSKRLADAEVAQATTPDAADRDARACVRKQRDWHALRPLDHRRVGLLQTGTALVFLVLGTLLGVLLRAQLARPGAHVLDAASYHQLLSMHGSAMVFLFAVPVMQGVGIYLLPAMLGARGLPFPRLAAFAYWLYAIGGTLLCSTLLAGVAPESGWALSMPLASYRYSPSVNVDFWLAGTALVEVSALAGAIQLLVAVLRTRAPGMSLSRMPVYAWSVLVASAMTIVGFAPLLLADLLLVLERVFHWPFFVAGKGGNPLLWPRLFWPSSRPDAALLLIPIAGLISMMAPGLARTRLAAHGWVVVALLAAGALAVLAWVMPLFEHVALPGLAQLAVAAQLALALPCGVLMAAWIATLRRGTVRSNVPLLWLLGALFAFACGGMSALMQALPPFSAQLSNSYFAVAKLHYVLISALLFPLLAALYYWAPTASGRQLSAGLGTGAFCLTFVGLHLAFFPMYALGFAGMPARVHSYPPGLGWEGWNLLATAGAGLLALGLCIVVLDLLLHFRVRDKVDANPWGAASLEWLPRHARGIRSIPLITSNYPLWDQPGLAREVDAGIHALSGMSGQQREQLISSAVMAQPQYSYVLPSRSPTGVLAAVIAAPAAFALALRLPLLAAAMLVVAAGALLTWLWWCDRPTSARTQTEPDAAAHPLAARSHAWLGVLALLAADAALFLSLALAYFYLWSGGQGPWPPLEQPLPILTAGVGAVVLWVTSSVVFTSAGPALGKRARAVPVLLGALVVHLAALVVAVYGVVAVGLVPQSHAYAALAAVVLMYQCWHALIVAAVTIFLIARVWTGLLDAAHRVTWANTRLIFHYAVAQGVLSAILLYVFPRIPG